MCVCVCLLFLQACMHARVCMHVCVCVCVSVSQCVCACFALKSKWDPSVYSLNMNRCMAQYCIRITFTRTEDFMIAKQPLGKIRSFWLFSFCCWRRFVYVPNVTMCVVLRTFKCFVFDVTFMLHTKQEKRCSAHIKDFTLLFPMISQCNHCYWHLDGKKIKKWQNMASSREVWPALLASSREGMLQAAPDAKVLTYWYCDQVKSSGMVTSRPWHHGTVTWLRQHVLISYTEAEL